MSPERPQALLKIRGTAFSEPAGDLVGGIEAASPRWGRVEASTVATQSSPVLTVALS